MENLWTVQNSYISFIPEILIPRRIVCRIFIEDSLLFCAFSVLQGQISFNTGCEANVNKSIRVRKSKYITIHFTTKNFPKSKKSSGNDQE